MIIRRFDENPIIRPHMDGRMGTNINGPSLIKVPDWVASPLGRYYLYFGDHRGTYIRLAYADALEGSWRIHPPGALDLADSYCVRHLASPDVHVDEGSRQFIMYYHGPVAGRGQLSRAATSRDGIHYTARDVIVGGAYLRAWRWESQWYGMTMGGHLLRSRNGLAAFERGPRLGPDDMRHLAVAVRGRDLHVFYTNAFACPERILHAVVGMEGDWSQWRAGEPEMVLEPHEEYEGASLPLVPSDRGPAPGPVRQLRDPAIYEEDGRTYLLYAVAGESGIGIAEIEAWKGQHESSQMTYLVAKSA